MIMLMLVINVMRNQHAIMTRINAYGMMNLAGKCSLMTSMKVVLSDESDTREQCCLHDLTF